MKINLVFCSHVNGLLFYDVHCVIDGTEFTLIPVLYSTIDYHWYVKLPDRPFFASTLRSDLFEYICNLIREILMQQPYE